VANAPVGIALLDRNSLVMDVNSYFETMFGYSQEELVGKDLDAVLAPGQRFELAREFTRKVDSGERVAGEAKRKCKDGSLLQVRLQGFPIYIRDKVSGVIALYEDITEKKRLEQELIKSEKLESIALLAGGIAHDFNNLLAGIMANISLVRYYERSNKQVLSVLTKAENACLRARDMTQQLLTFSKGGEPVRRVFHWEGPLRQTVEFSLTGSDVSCTLDIQEGLRPLQADHGQINQVVQNLVINAVQSMPGGGELIVRAENADIGEETMLPLEPGKYVLLKVSDNGVGIPAEAQERIFDPYYSTKEGGTGLGLAIVFSIVNKHGGWIQVFSEQGRGTDFYVYLPAADDLETEVQKGESDQEGREWEKARLLFMDDEKELVEVTVSLLEELGYEVVPVSHGQEAIEEYAKAFSGGEKFDVVIMDLTVPGRMGGREAMEALLRLDPEVRAIASSGYSSDPVMSRFADFGFKAALVKPYKIEELDALIQKVIAADQE
ncbi:MAG: ATP-binding protein, partial [Desulfonatronovibrionaceae bacterium]